MYDKLLGFSKVLCLSPHPDDVELGMLGTILNHRSTVFHILTMTICGAKGFDDSYKLDRVSEVKALWKEANYPNHVMFLRTPCDWFEDKTESGWIHYLDRHVGSMDYDAIFLPPQQDSMFEHRYVNSFGSVLTRSKPISLIEYHSTSTLNTWQPNFYVDITRKYKEKAKLLENFKSQVGKPYFQPDVMESKCINYQCRKKGLKYVESYNIVELFEGV